MKKKSLFRKAVAVFLALALVFQFAPEKVQSKDTSDAIYLAFTSDIHTKCQSLTDPNNADPYKGSSVETMDNWLTAVSNRLGGVTFDAMGFCGDMAYTSPSNSPTFFKRAQCVIDAVERNPLVTKGIYTTGNHEYKPGTFNTVEDEVTQATKAKYIVVGEAARTDDYIIYCFGSSQYDEIELQENLDILEAYLQQHGNETSPSGKKKPIFIMTHCPLHEYNVGEVNGIHNGTSPQNTDKLLAILNNYSNVILFWGHNHSNNQVNYDVIWDNINGTPINFTYCSAGCMSDEEYNTSTYASAKVIAKGIVAKIEDGNVTLTYYDKLGNPLLGAKEINPDTRKMMDANETDPLSVVPLRLANSSFTYNKTRVYKVNVNEGQNLNVDVYNVYDKEMQFDIISNNTLVAASASQTVTVAAGGKASFVLKGEHNGLASVIVQAKDGSNTASATISVRVGNGISSSGKYLIIRDNHILTIAAAERTYNSNGTNYHDGRASIELTPTTEITDDMLWKFTPHIDGYYITNGENYLAATYRSSNSTLTVGTTQDPWDIKDGFIRSVNATKQNASGSTYSDKYLTFGNASAADPNASTAFIVRSVADANMVSVMACDGTNPLADLVLDSITINPNKITVKQGKNIKDYITVTAHYKDSLYTADVTDKAVIINESTAEPGEFTFIVEYTENQAAVIAYLQVTVEAYTAADYEVTPAYDDYSFYSINAIAGTRIVVDVINTSADSLTYTVLNGDDSIVTVDRTSTEGTADEPGRFTINTVSKGLNIIKVHAESGNHKYDALIAVNVGDVSQKVITTDKIASGYNEIPDDSDRVVHVDAVEGDIVYVYYQNSSGSSTPREYWPKVINEDEENPVGRMVFESDGDQFLYTKKYAVVPVKLLKDGKTTLYIKSYGTNPYYVKVIINAEKAPKEYELEINPKQNDFNMYEMSIDVGDKINATIINTVGKQVTFSVENPDESIVSVNNSSVAVTADENGHMVINGLKKGLAIIKVHTKDGNNNYDALVAVNVGGSESVLHKPDLFTAFKNEKVEPGEDHAKAIHVDATVGDVIYFYYQNGSTSTTPRVYNSTINPASIANFMFAEDSSQSVVASMYSIIPVRVLSEGKSVLSMISVGNDPYYGKLVINASAPEGEKVLDSITVEPAELTVDEGEDIDGLFTVTAHYADMEYTKDVTADAVVSGYDKTVAGEQNVTVSYTENGITKTATIKVTVNKVIPADLIVNPKYDDYEFYNVSVAVNGTVIVDVVDTSEKNITYSVMNGDSSIASVDKTSVVKDGKKDGRFIITGLAKGLNIIKVHGEDGNHKYDALIAVNVGEDAGKTITTNKILAYKNDKVEPADDDSRVVKVDAQPGDVVYIYYQNGSTSTTPREYWPTIRNDVGSFVFSGDADQFVYASMYGVIPVKVNKYGTEVVSVKSYGSDPYFFKVIINAVEPVVLTDIEIIDNGYSSDIPEGTDIRDLLKVNAVYSDETKKDVTADAVISGYDKNKVGSQTVTVSYTEDGVTKSVQIKVFVKCTECDFDNWIIDKDPTIIEEGTKHRFCKRCGSREDGVIEKLEHVIINGPAFAHTKESGKDLLIISNGLLKVFSGVTVDGVYVEEANYTVVEGSIEVTLKSSYLDTLETGFHSFEIVVEGADSAAARFEIKDATVDPEPDTGDHSLVKLWVGLSAVAVAGGAVVLLKKRED